MMIATRKHRIAFALSYMLITTLIANNSDDALCDARLKLHHESICHLREDELIAAQAILSQVGIDESSVTFYLYDGQTCSTKNAIFLSKSEYPTLPIEEKAFIVAHEAIHIKYNDTGTFLTTHTWCKQNLPGVLSSLASQVAYFVTWWNAPTKELRADKEAVVILGSTAGARAYLTRLRKQFQSTSYRPSLEERLAALDAYDKATNC